MPIPAAVNTYLPAPILNGNIAIQASTQFLVNGSNFGDNITAVAVTLFPNTISVCTFDMVCVADLISSIQVACTMLQSHMLLSCSTPVSVVGNNDVLYSLQLQVGSQKSNNEYLHVPPFVFPPN